MATSSRPLGAMFAVAGLSIVLAVVAGVAWLGQPLRMVHLLTIVGLSMTAGVSWAQAVARARERRRERDEVQTR